MGQSNKQRCIIMIGITIGYITTDPDPKSCAIQKQNSGMINTHLNGGGAEALLNKSDFG